MMKVNRIRNRVLCALLCAVLLAGILPAATPRAYAADKGYLTIRGDYSSVNLRVKPDGEYIEKWEKASLKVLPFEGEPVSAGGYSWYKVIYTDDKVANREYYVRADFVAECTENGTLTDASGQGSATAAPAGGEDAKKEEDKPDAPTATQAPTPTAAPTQAPVGDGYVTILEGYSSVNLRDGADGKYMDVWERGVPKVLPYTGAPITKGGVSWYQVTYTNKRQYYVSGEIVAPCAADGTVLAPATAAPASGGTPAPTAENAGYVKTTKSGVNLRRTPGGDAFSSLNKNVIVPYYGTPAEKGGFDWYDILYNGLRGYIRSDCLVLCDAGGNEITAPTAAPSAAAGSTAVPAPAGSGTIRLTANHVNFRKSPSGALIKRLDKGTVLPYTRITSKDGYAWYEVTYNGAEGYIRGDVCEIVSQGDSATPTPSAVVGYLKLIKGGVNLRNRPAGSSMEQLDEGLVLPILSAPVSSGSYTWYNVKAPSGILGYVRSDCIQLTDGGGSATATPAPTGSPAAGSYVMITKNSVNFRKSPGGSYIRALDKNDVYPMTGSVSTSGGYTWYPIQVGSANGYVRGDCAQQLNQEQVEAYLNGKPIPSGTPAPTKPVMSSYVITVLDDVNLRASASKDSEAKYNVAKGTVMGYSLAQSVGGATWYKAVYKNTEIWVLGSCVNVMTTAEYEAWRAANPDADEPTTEVIAGYVKLTSDEVNLRKTAGGKVIGRLGKGTLMPYSDVAISGGHYWYNVNSPLGRGYVMDDMLQITDKAGNPVATPTPGSSGGKPEASYTTLKRGSTGDDVKRMVTELKAQGFYSGSISSSFTSAVEAAVKAFQKAKNLSVDGIAGPNTLHALFGTVPVGTNTDINMTIYPVEKISWASMNTVWARGKNAQVMDVKTGIAFGVRRWAGGLHADVEPLTAADSAKMCKIYGVSATGQITARKHYQRRPLWVTYNGHTYAASMYGVPHNYPDGDTIANNNFNGQFCIHFVGSKVHNSGKVDSGHQEAIQYAYDHAPNGKK